MQTYRKGYKDHTIYCDVKYNDNMGSISVSTIIDDQEHRLLIEEDAELYNVILPTSTLLCDTLDQALNRAIEELQKRIDDHIESKLMFTTRAVEALDKLGFVGVFKPNS